MNRNQVFRLCRMNWGCRDTTVIGNYRKIVGFAGFVKVLEVKRKVLQLAKQRSGIDGRRNRWII